jgi:hypothetical protein
VPTDVQGISKIEQAAIVKEASKFKDVWAQEREKN